MNAPRPFPRDPATRDRLLLVAAFALLYLAGLGARDLWNPNEPLYGQAVREMERSGSWLRPTVEGRPFDEKPPLVFALARAAAAVAGGVDAGSVRLPSALCGLALVALLHAWVGAYAGRGRAAWAAGLLGTTYIVFWNARTLQMDLPLALGCAAALFCATRRLDLDAPALRSWAAAGGALGLAILAKGPVAAVLVALPLAAYALATGRTRRLAEPAALALPAVAAAVALPALAATAGGAWGADGGSLREMLFRQNVTRFLDAWDHARPWWYYLKEFWPDMAPWGFLVPLAAGLARDDGERRLHALAWVWLATTVVFFSLSESKRSVYLLPAAPAVAILAAAVLHRLQQGRLAGARLRVALLVQATIGGILIAAGAWGRTEVPGRWPEAGPGLALALTIAVVAGAVAALGVAVYRLRPAATPLAFVVAVAAFQLGAAIWGLPAVDPLKSARGFAADVERIVPPDRPLAAYALWEWRASYTWALDRPLERLDDREALRSWWRRDGPAFLLVERGMLDDAREVLGDAEPLASREIGSNAVHLFGRPAAAPPRGGRSQDAPEPGTPQARAAWSARNSASPSAIQCSRFASARARLQPAPGAAAPPGPPAVSALGSRHGASRGKSAGTALR